MPSAAFLLLASLLSIAPAGAQLLPEQPPSPPEPIRPPYFSCGIERRDAIGTLRAHRFVYPNGVREDPIFSWTVEREPGGIGLDAAWGAEGPEDSSFVQIAYSGVEANHVYRIQVRRSAQDGPDELTLQSDLKRPEDGRLHIFTAWGPLRATLANADDPRLVVLDGDGNVVRSDPIDPAAFNRAAVLAASLTPELDAMVADYRNRCNFVESLERPLRIDP